MLIAIVPYFTMAQKRSKKSSKATYEMMVIKGVEISLSNIPEEDREQMSRDQTIDYEAKISLERGRLMITFDFGNVNSKETVELINEASKYNSMIAAVNALASKGWEFVSANVVSSSTNITKHYYYMRRDR